MAARLPQLVPPGSPSSNEPISGSYEICWSVYIQCSNRQKLREVHIPALNEVIGEPHGPRTWSYVKEDHLGPDRDPNEHRIVAVEQIDGPYTDHFAIELFKRLYALKSDWRITARLDQRNKSGVYMMARHTSPPGNAAPAVTDVLVELQPIVESAFRCFGDSRPIRPETKPKEE